jgi:Flp pilus assembly protein TadD
MGKTVRLQDQVWILAQECIQTGRDHRAIRLLLQLSTFGQLDSQLAEQVHSQLAELYLRQRRYRKARRSAHLALALQPGCARYHHQLARSWNEDPRGDAEQARTHFRKAVELEPNHPTYLMDYGVCLLAWDEAEAGLEHLRRAVEQEPDDVKYVRPLALKLVESDQPEAARQTVVHALFRNPRNARFKKLWNEVRFSQAHRTQQRIGHDGAALDGQRRVILPLHSSLPEQDPGAPAAPAEEANGPVAARNEEHLRFDRPEPAPRPYLARRTRRQQNQ